jgi:hypothetical protein
MPFSNYKSRRRDAHHRGGMGLKRGQKKKTGEKRAEPRD